MTYLADVRAWDRQLGVPLGLGLGRFLTAQLPTGRSHQRVHAASNKVSIVLEYSVGRPGK